MQTKFLPAKNRNKREDTFPYLNSGPASNTDGTLGASNDGPSLAINEPAGVEASYSTRGKIIPASISNTDYIDTNTVTHSVLAGNS